MTVHIYFGIMLFSLLYSLDQRPGLFYSKLCSSYNFCFFALTFVPIFTHLFIIYVVLLTHSLLFYCIFNFVVLSVHLILVTNGTHYSHISIMYSAIDLCGGKCNVYSNNLMVSCKCLSRSMCALSLANSNTSNSLPVKLWE